MKMYEIDLKGIKEIDVDIESWGVANYSIIARILFTSNNKEEWLTLPTSEEKLMNVFNKIHGQNYSVKLAVTNCGIKIYDETKKELVGFDNIERKKLVNLQYEDSEDFKYINDVIKELNNISEAQEVKAITDYISINAQEVLDIIKRKKYNIIPYKTEEEFEEYMDCGRYDNNLLTKEGYFKTTIGKLNFYDEKYSKGVRGNENIYQIPEDYEKGICSICGKEYTDFGGNADPINYGRCCNQCDRNVVFEIRVFNHNISGMVRRTRPFIKQLSEAFRSIKDENKEQVVIPMYFNNKKIKMKGRR